MGKKHVLSRDIDGPDSRRTNLFLSAWEQNLEMAVTSRPFGVERTDEPQMLEKSRSLLQATYKLDLSATTES